VVALVERRGVPGLPAVAGVPARASVLLRFCDGGVEVQRRESGWAVTEPGWVLFLSDEAEGDEAWQSFPSSSVVCVEWCPVEVAA
jgi:hypothetical protein